jgi:hypothetical protein
MLNETANQAPFFGFLGIKAGTKNISVGAPMD